MSPPHELQGFGPFGLESLADWDQAHILRKSHVEAASIRQPGLDLGVLVGAVVKDDMQRHTDLSKANASEPSYL